MAFNLKRTSASALFLLATVTTSAQVERELTVKEIMNEIITPTTGTIWGAYQLQTDAEWLEVENAAMAVIEAGTLLGSGGADETFQLSAQEEDWKQYNREMIAAARSVLAAVADKDEDALFAAGNDELYPPCESCHQQYQPR